MAICSFCGQDKKQTKEHVWSSNLLEGYRDLAPKTFDHKRNLVHGADPMVKDICQDCNGGMSEADTAIMNFAGTYLVGDFTNWTYIPFDDPKLLRWALKTASNMERSLKLDTTWWMKFIPFFKGDHEVEHIGQADLLLATWTDMTPAGLEEHGGAQIFGTTLLAARSLDFGGLKTVSSEALAHHLETAWALKVNNGIFGVIVWSPDTPEEIRTSTIAEARTFGWLDSKTDTRMRQIPYNTYTCTMYYRIGQRDEVPGLRRIS